jgi:hypothetical protein
MHHRPWRLSLIVKTMRIIAAPGQRNRPECPSVRPLPTDDPMPPVFAQSAWHRHAAYVGAYLQHVCAAACDGPGWHPRLFRRSG